MPVHKGMVMCFEHTLVATEPLRDAVRPAAAGWYGRHLQTAVARLCRGPECTGDRRADAGSSINGGKTGFAGSRIHQTLRDSR